MKKVALVFVLAVLVPSLVLAWLALRSLRDQQFLLERQQSLLDQRVTDTLARDIADYLVQRQQEFSAQVETLAANDGVETLAAHFDDELRQHWPLAEVGFCVTAAGKILSPPPKARPAAQMFRLDNSSFLGNREPVEVYLTANNPGGNAGAAYVNNLGNSYNYTRNQAAQPALNNLNASPQAFAINDSTGRDSLVPRTSRVAPAGSQAIGSAASSKVELAAANPAPGPAQTLDAAGGSYAAPNGFGGQRNASPPPAQNNLNFKAAQSRKVSPQSQKYLGAENNVENRAGDNLSKVVPAEAEFGQLIGDQADGMLARFLQNKLKLMCWHRLKSAPDLIFGAQLNLDGVRDGLRGLVEGDRPGGGDICVAVLDDNAKPAVLSRRGFQANWKRPFVATEIGDALPHWEVAAYLVDPAQLTQAAHTARLTLGLLVAVLVIAIGIGSVLIVRALEVELKLARQKTDFVSNVSHELKTPLTSIRMFSELLAEGRVTDPAKQRSYSRIITAEAARLTRLINNVLDFSRLERGEKKYNFQPCDLTELVRATADAYRPHLEAAGFRFDCELPAASVPARGDADALSQIIVNLLSNAEKYSGGGREIALQLALRQSPLPHAEIRVLDRGPGVPRGSEEKIFEKFYRAHDSLSSGIQGSGLGLTIARQIARAHGGDVVCEPRAGGGSCFILRLPVPNRESRA